MMTDNSSDADRAPPATPKTRSRRLRTVLLAGIALASLGAGANFAWSWWTHGRFVEETTDAYTQSDLVAVGARISGYIATVDVADNQRVTAGQVLARIDDRDMRAALDAAKAATDAARADVTNLEAQIQLQSLVISQAEQTVTMDQAALTFSQQEYDRYMDLARRGYGTVQRSQQADADIRSKTAQLQHDRDALAAARKQVELQRAQLTRAQAVVEQSMATLRQAELNLEYTVIKAPTDGYVGDRTVRVGQYVQPGTQLLSVVPLGTAVYVVANFKETQLGHMAPGQPVSLTFDMMGGDLVSGTVESIAPGTGSTFALLPPENATGNFTKIVQRVPVRIVIAQSSFTDRFRPGLSVDVSVDTHAPAGPANASIHAEVAP